jgi:hypothetical protein
LFIFANGIQNIISTKEVLLYPADPNFLNLEKKAKHTFT